MPLLTPAGGGRMLHMKEMGFLVIRIRIEQPVKAANSYVASNALFTLK